MSEEEELKGIRREVWWLSTFLVKIPLFIGGCVLLGWIVPIVWAWIDWRRLDWENLLPSILAIVIVVLGASYFIIRYTIPWFKKLWNS